MNIERSTWMKVLRKQFNIDVQRNNPVIALAGNPNTGKSTVFNELTGLKQHTGNWPGKTVTQAQGYYNHQGQEYTIVDLPGTYSLLATSTDELVARDFICFAIPDATIVMADATNLERNLNLVLQITELTNNVVLCLNLMDEAVRKNIEIDVVGLEKELGIPVVPTVARDGEGIKELKEVVADIVSGRREVKPNKVEYSTEIEEEVDKLVPELEEFVGDLNVNLEWLALKILEGDQTVLNSINDYYFAQLSADHKAEIEGEVDINEVI